MSSKDDSLNREEFEKMWEATRSGDEYDRIIFVTSAHLGMRSSEIANMKRSWVDFGRQVVQIPYKSGDWNAKNKSAARTIPYGNMRHRVKKELETFFDYHEEVPVDRRTVWYRVKRMAKSANITRNVYPHSLRATAAFQFAEAGLSAQALRQIMGWSQLNTAQSYINQTGRAAERELEKKGNNLW